MAYCLTKISKDERVCKLLEQVEEERDLLISSAKTFYTQCIEQIKELDSINNKILLEKLEWHRKTLAAANEFLRVKWHIEATKSQTSEAFVEVSPCPIPAFEVELNTMRVMSVSCYNSATDFWLVPAFNSCKDQFTSLLRKKYKSRVLHENTNPSPGETVIAETPLGIIRGLVLKESTQDRLQLLDVDSGQVLEPTGKIYKPDTDSLALQQQAVHCSLSKNDELHDMRDDVVRKKLCANHLDVTFEEELGGLYCKYSVVVEQHYGSGISLPRSPQSCLSAELTIARKYPNEHGNEKSVTNHVDTRQVLRENHVESVTDIKQDDADMSISSASISSYKNPFKIGIEYKVMISNVVSCDEIYAHIVNKETTQMDALHNRMKKVYDHPSKPGMTGTLGDHVAVYSDRDQLWLRGRVESMSSDENLEDEVTVKLIDFGETLVVPESSCADLLPIFEAVPVMAHCFALAQVYPPSKSWPSSTIDILNSLISSGVIKLYVVTEADENSPPTVVLSTTKDAKEVCVNEYLVEQGLAVSQLLGKDKVVTPRCEQTDATVEAEDDEEAVFAQWDPMLEDFSSDHQDDTNVNQAVLGYDPQDEKKICYLFLKTGKCDRLHCRKEHKQLHPDGWTGDTETVYITAFNELSYPVPGTECNFMVTEAKCVNKMYGMMSHENISALENPHGHGSMDELVELINTPSELNKLEHLTILPCVGHIVLARTSAKEFFYRARVLEVADSSHTQHVDVKVVYVDYGTVEWVSLQNIRAIKPKFLHLPFQAVEFVIVDMEVIDTLVEKAQQKFFEVINSQELTALVVGIHQGMNQMWSIWAKQVRAGDRLLSDILRGLVRVPKQNNLYKPSTNAYILPD